MGLARDGLTQGRLACYISLAASLRSVRRTKIARSRYLTKTEPPKPQTTGVERMTKILEPLERRWASTKVKSIT